MQTRCSRTATGNARSCSRRATRKMDGDPSITELAGAIAPVLARLREEMHQRLAELEVEFGERMVEALSQMRELLDESRRRAEDAIRESAEAMRNLSQL